MGGDMRLKEMVEKLQENMQLRRQADSDKLEVIHTTNIELKTIMLSKIVPMIEMYQKALYGGNGDKIGIVARVKNLEEKVEEKVEEKKENKGYFYKGIAAFLTLILVLSQLYLIFLK